MSNPIKIKMLSLWQPWANLCVWKNPDGKAEKQIETRHWSTNYRGLIAIHATKTLQTYGLEALETNVEIQNAFCRHGFQKVGSSGFTGILHFGAIVGVVTLKDIVQFESDFPSILDDYPERERHFGNHAALRFGWIFTNPIEFKEPISCRGLQNLGTPKSDIATQIYNQLEIIKEK